MLGIWTKDIISGWKWKKNKSFFKFYTIWIFLYFVAYPYNDVIIIRKKKQNATKLVLKAFIWFQPWYLINIILIMILIFYKYSKKDNLEFSI